MKKRLFKIFKRKEKFTETPAEKRKCSCGFPFGPLVRTYEGAFFPKQVVVAYQRTCPMCKKETTIYG